MQETVRKARVIRRQGKVAECKLKPARVIVKRSAPSNTVRAMLVVVPHQGRPARVKHDA